jgi:predicted nucleic acid-binding Zn ribbon protein
MPTYIYETIPQASNELPLQFEVWQSMKEDALTHHPETGAPVRRIIVGGFAPIGVEKPKASGGHSCGQGGCCHN